MDSIIRECLEKMVDKLIPTFLSNIPDKEKDAFAEKYKVFLEEKYAYHFNKNIFEDGDDIEETIEDWVKYEHGMREKYSYAKKKTFLFPDPYFVELEQISFDVYAKASAFAKNELTEALSQEYYEETKKRIKICLKKVEKEYGYHAHRMYSEIILDLDFIFKNSPNKSFRMSHYT